MLFKIGPRVWKTALGAATAVLIAQMLGLEFYSSAGIIVILCVSVTRRGSLQASWQRIGSCIVAIFYSVIFFELIGYHPWTLALILLLFIPTTVKFKVNEGIASSSVIILHFYTVGTVTTSFVMNEVLLVLIGVGIALLVNLYMPSHEKALKKYQEEIDRNFSTILSEMSSYLRHGESDWEGKEITETVDLLKSGKNIALLNIQNHILRYEDDYYYYFKMRENQFEILERVMPYVSTLQQTIEQSEMIADFLDELSHSVSPANNVPYFLERLEEMKRDFEKMSLPQTREEFEIRSNLFYITRELEEYLHIKNRLWNHVDKKKL